MKITNDVAEELQKIRSAIDDAYNKLNVILYERVLAAKTTYKPSNPSDKIKENFEYIVQKLNAINDESEVVGKE